jgi:hypothetical protein
MTSAADFVQPPRLASWLLNLFIPPDREESILAIGSSSRRNGQARPICIAFTPTGLASIG